MAHRVSAEAARRPLGAVGVVALALTLLAASAACAADELRIQTGPILGAFDADWFTVTCRTNAEAPVKVALAATDAEPEKVVAESAAAMIHRLKVPRAAGAARGYVLIAGDNALRAPLAAPAPIAKGEEFTFVAMGDSRTYPKHWAAVAAAALKARPRFVLFTGDMVAHGLDDASWDRDFFGPAQELFAATPLYCVMGNHEENGAALRRDLLQSLARRANSTVGRRRWATRRSSAWTARRIGRPGARTRSGWRRSWRRPTRSSFSSRATIRRGLPGRTARSTRKAGRGNARSARDERSSCRCWRSTTPPRSSPGMTIVTSEASRKAA